MSDDLLDDSKISEITIVPTSKRFMDIFAKDKIVFSVEIFLIFMSKVFKKIVEAFISVKLWIIIAVFVSCRDLLIKDFITGDNFTTIVTSILSVAIAMRGISKIALDVTETILKNRKG